MTRAPQRIGPLAGVYAAVVPLVLVGELAFALQHEALLLRALLDPKLGRALGALGVLAVLVLLVPGLLVLRSQRARAPRTHGRGRLLWTAIGGVVHALGLVGEIAVLVQPESLRLLQSGLGLTVPRGLQSLLIAAVVVSTLGRSIALIASVSAFWLIPRAARARFWLVFDTVLGGAVVVALLKLPAEPPEHAPQALGLPVLRLTITAIAVVRLFLRLLPRMLDLVEASGFEPLVAARHLRSKMSGFLTAISVLSVLAVGLSCVALTVTLSVMGGFRNDLKRKILGNNAHIMVDRDPGRIDDWQAVLHTVEGAPGVAGAAPFVSGEVMLSSASNLATAVLRGIDPSRIGKVNDLPHNLTSGKLGYLVHPEKLLEAPPDDSRASSLLFGGSKVVRVGRARGRQHAARDAGTGSDTTVSPSDAGAITRDEPLAVHAVADGGSLAARADAGTAVASHGAAGGGGSPAPALTPKLDLEKRLDSLEAFLRDPSAARERPSDRELLPGIIIGQELARALRLYVGDEVNVVAPLGALGPSGPMPKSRPFRVAGVFYSGMYEYDMKFTYVALETAQKFLNTGDTVSGIEARVDEIERAPDAARRLREALDGKDLRVRDWQELNSRLFGALALEKLAMFVALGIAILVASFCIAGTLTLMVQEKGREVAILKAMGSSDRAVVRMFVIEGGLIGLLGAALGLFFGYVLCFAAAHFGIRMNPEVYYIDRLPVQVDATEFSLTGIAAIVVCLVVTIYPALLASRLRPVDALRYE